MIKVGVKHYYKQTLWQRATGPLLLLRRYSDSSDRRLLPVATVVSSSDGHRDVRRPSLL
jgi:hypothetical protein